MSLTPGLRHIRYMTGLFDDARLLDPTELFAFINIVRFMSAMTVWTYSPPADPCIPVTDDRLFRIAGLSPSMWESVKEQVFSMFDVRDGHLWPRDGWFYTVVGSERPQIPAELRRIIGERDNWTCGYCGSKDGPFDIDHVIPVSRGGAVTDPDNLLCACATCNRRKSDKLVAEWVA